MTKVIRKHKKFTLYRSSPSKPRGRGAKFQWNVESEYAIISFEPDYPEKKFKTLAEADKEWVYLVLKYS